MDKKEYSVKKRYQLYNILSWLGVAIALFGFFLEGSTKSVFTWVGLGFVVIAVIFRFTMVKCPECGNRLAQSKSIPDRCPECDKELH